MATSLIQTRFDVGTKWAELSRVRVKVTFCDAVSMIHDVITTAYPFPYTAKFMFVGFRINKTQQIRQ